MEDNDVTEASKQSFLCSVLTLDMKVESCSCDTCGPHTQESSKD